MARRDKDNPTRYWSDPRIPGVSLLRAEFRTFPYVPHVHDTYVIAATETGGAAITCRGRTEEARPATIFLSNPREPQAASMPPGGLWRYRAFYLSEDGATSLARRLGIDQVPDFLATQCTDPAVAGGIVALHRALEEKVEMGPDAPMRLTDAIGALLEGYGTVRRPAMTARSGASHAAVQQVIALMRDRCADRLRLEDLSSALGLSPFQLIALFKRTVGMTPYTYLIQVRLDEARRHLRSGRSIADAAVASGFYDQSALTRHFKRSYGITPLQFMAAGRACPARG